MKPVSILSCPNGWGHFKRAALLLAELERCGLDACILTNASKWEEFCEFGQSLYPNISKVRVKNYSWLPQSSDYKNRTNFLSQFHQLAKETQDQYLLSDNYLEPFAFGARGTLIANFFWHKLFAMPDEYERALEPALKSDDCHIVSTVFGNDYITKQTGTNILPLFDTLKKQHPEGNYIVLSLGFGSWSDGYRSLFNDFLQQNAMDLPEIIYCDPALQGQIEDGGVKSQVKFAPFTRDLLAGAKAIIGRPSLGIVTDALSFRVPFFALADDQDHESMHNKNIIESLYSDIDEMPYYASWEAFRRKLKTYQISFGGEKLLAQEIRDRILQ